MENNMNTDDDRQTSSSEQKNSSDTLSSVSSETILPVQPQISNMSNIRVCRVKVENRTCQPNLKIKHPNRPNDDGNDPFNDDKRTILDKHIKISHINHSNLPHVTTATPTPNLKTHSSGKTLDSHHGNQNRSKNVNGNLNNGDTTKITPRERPVQITRTSTAVNANQGSNKKVINSKIIVTRIPMDGLPSKKKRKGLHVSIRRVPDNSKKSS